MRPETLPAGLSLALFAGLANWIWLADWLGLTITLAFLGLAVASGRPSMPALRAHGLAVLRFLIYGLALALFRLGLGWPTDGIDGARLLGLGIDVLRLPLAVLSGRWLIGHFTLEHCRNLASPLAKRHPRQAEMFSLMLWLPAWLGARVPELARAWRLAAFRSSGQPETPFPWQFLRVGATFLPWMLRGLNDLAGRLEARLGNFGTGSSID